MVIKKNGLEFENYYQIINTPNDPNSKYAVLIEENNKTKIVKYGERKRKKLKNIEKIIKRLERFI
jgi:hypothetical protein